MKENILGIAAGTFTCVSLLPQLIKMIKEKKATDISVLMLVTLLTGLCLWVWYGMWKEDVPLIVTNSVSLVINLLIIALRAYYKNKMPAQRIRKI